MTALERACDFCQTHGASVTWDPAHMACVCRVGGYPNTTGSGGTGAENFLSAVEAMAQRVDPSEAPGGDPPAEEPEE